MAVRFAAPRFLRQGVVAGFVLSAPDWQGVPPGTGASISFTFVAADITVMSVVIHIATGYQHQVTIGGDVFSYVQQDLDTPTVIATALANAINGAPEALATATSVAGVLSLAPRQNTGNAIACTASDGNTAQTLFELTGNELVPAISKGVLFAQGTMYRPATAPVLAAATASQQSWLYYSSTGGWYWRSVSTPLVSDDACVGWVVCNAASVIAVSSSKIGAGDEALVVPGGPVSAGVGATGFDSGVPGAPAFDVAETPAQLQIGDLTIAGGPANTDGITFASLLLYFVDESVTTTTTLTADVASGPTAIAASAALAASVPGSVTFTFYNATHLLVTIGPGYVHSISIGLETYTYAQQVEDTAAQVATALANLINASADPNALATAVGATVVLTAMQNTGSPVTCSASDGNTPATLTETEPSYVVIDQEIIEVKASDGSVVVRGALGSTAAAHLAGALIWPVNTMTVVFALPQFAYGTPLWPTIVGLVPWASKALAAATCWVANEVGPSPFTTECFIAGGAHLVDRLGNQLPGNVTGVTVYVSPLVTIGQETGAIS